MTEPASVVAARQLAEEAWARRSRIECATSAVTSERRQHSVRTRRARAALLAAAAASTAGCGSGLALACPAIGYGSALVVELAPDWPGGVDRSVEFDCDPVCLPPILELEQASPVPLPDTPAAPAPTPTTPAADPVVPVDGRGRAAVQLFGAWPVEVTVRVLEAGTVVAELTVQPEFARVDGTEECGGNAEARIVVPAP